ncbi:Immunoglobulin E-set [Pseudocohnilembus persalinus]|uniref:Immunoglobulin E-set n=1 Tax=Pseudocohnilembus persalinus TaxID=266149 RepID=A0A0V0QBE8_PSEPJ|nr:Immunoglobulin E-set [Pseudocohnilembus persalinus]|eukprot:KRW99489.1 Immunoglobulin E-set [Pseudocohnilembus persalinus]
MQNIDLSDYKKITPEIVTQFNKPTDKFLCPLNANRFHIQFLDFKIRDVDTNDIFFEISREPSDNFEEEINIEIPPEHEEQIRTVRYDFSDDFFKLKNIGTSLSFSVGKLPVKDFLMIERHYFRNQLIKSFDFKFPFCIPNTTNNWESIYDVPKIDPELQQQMIDNPYETKSDSFYFVGNELIMHNKAEYAYNA